MTQPWLGNRYPEHEIMPFTATPPPVGKAKAGDPPDAVEVSRFHTKADTDGKEHSIHHTLGAGKFQASPGSHTHDGSNSAVILDGVTLNGAKGGNVALAAVIDALVKLGAVDSTTA